MLIENHATARFPDDSGRTTRSETHREGNLMTAILPRRAQYNPGYMYGMTRRDLLITSALGLLAGTPRPVRALPRRKAS